MGRKKRATATVADVLEILAALTASALGSTPCGPLGH
jgi:hypothetical protein